MADRLWAMLWNTHVRNICVKEARTRLVIRETQSEGRGLTRAPFGQLLKLFLLAQKLSHYTGNTPVSKH